MTSKSAISPKAAAIAAAFAFSLPAPAEAQEAARQPSLLLDLNALQSSNGGCRLTFVVSNGLPTPIDRAAFEMALFDKEGVVDRLTVLDFRDMPRGKTKVSRFDLSGVKCADISRVLVNQATECQGTNVEANACMTGLRTETRTPIVFGV